MSYPHYQKRTPIGGPLPVKKQSASKNNVQQLLSYCHGFKTEIGKGDIADGQNLLGPIAHIEKNLIKLQYKPADVRARGIRNVSKYLQRLLPEDGAEPSARQQHIEQIITNAIEFNG